VKVALILMLLAQTADKGVVTGRVRAADGSPAAGVRVYAMSVAEPKEAAGNVAPPLEGLSQTDEAGQFRLEVPAGKYVIAAGSVESPTYAPGTRDLTSARVISITSTALVDNVDISGYVAPRPLPAGVFNPNLTGTGFLSGVIQHDDGTPAAGIYVSATLVGLFNARATARITRTDNTGRYRLENLLPDTFYIVAGFADSQTLYPGVPDIASASPVTVTPTTKLDNLNFTIPSPPTGTIVRGRIFGARETPVAGATVQVRPNSPPPVVTSLPARPAPQAESRADGSFEIRGVAPGAYVAVAMSSDARPISKNIVVTEDKPLELEFSFPITVVGGRILSEDGTPFADPQAVGEVALVSGNNPDAILTTLFPLDAAGRFSRTMGEGEYRVSLRTLPVDYSIHSMTSAGTDLLKETLKVTTAGPVDIEVRLAKRASSSQVLEDGSFEFTGVTRGRYTVQLSGTHAVIDDAVVVGDADVSDVTLLAAAELVQLGMRVASDDGNPAAAAGVTIRFTGTSELVKIVAVANANTGLAFAWVPAGNSYSVTVSNIPDGYILKAIGGGDGKLMTGGRLSVVRGTIPDVMVTLGKK
jgi:hypothetical protein